MKQPSSAAKPLVLTQGDPAGVGAAASLLAWQALNGSPDHCFYLRGGAAYLRAEAKRLGLNVPIIEIGSSEDTLPSFPEGLPVLSSSETPAVEVGKPDISTAPGIISSIEDSVNDVWTGVADAVVTNPISKALLYSAGFKHPGHTEFLAHLAGKYRGSEAPLPIMLLVGGGLKVALATIHIPLMSVASKLNPEHIARVGEIVFRALRNDFALAAPRLGICGLNPHAGEDGTLGTEDRDIIIPAIKAMTESGITAIGPRPGDTIFHEALNGQYDAVLAMYHDQGLIPVKTLDIWGGVNVTLGLPFVRTSPDHGTGYDAAAAGQVRADSLIAAIRLARTMADNRKVGARNV